MSQIRHQTNARARRHGAATAVVALLLLLSGCDRLLRVDDPDVATPESLQNEASLATVLNSALADFATAYGGYAGAGGGAGDGEIVVSGALADELRHTGTFNTRQEIDQRKITTDNGQIEDAFRELHRARSSAQRAIALYDEFQPAAAGLALAHDLTGYTYLFFGENWCSGVPISNLLPGGVQEYGQPLPTDSLFNRAIAEFDQAIGVATAAKADDYLNLARVGKARALLNLNRPAEAASVAAPVPTAFEFVIEHSANTTRENNGVWYLNINTGRYSVVTGEGGNGLAYLTTPADPRVPWKESGNPPFDQTLSIPLLEQGKYPERGSPTVLASGIEARLVQAESALRAGDVGAFATIHQNLRSTVGLGPLATTGLSAGQLVDLHFRERAMWLWLTSHRLGDMRRLVRQYGRGAEQVFPTGEYYRPGQQYGTDVNLPIPVQEENNPNFQQCLDRNA